MFIEILVVLEHQLLVLLLEQLAYLALVIVKAIYDLVKLGTKAVELLALLLCRHYSLLLLWLFAGFGSGLHRRLNRHSNLYTLSSLMIQLGDLSLLLHVGQLACQVRMHILVKVYLGVLVQSLRHEATQSARTVRLHLLSGEVAGVITDSFVLFKVMCALASCLGRGRMVHDL